MKVNLNLFINNTYQTQELHEDFAGVTTYEKKRGGEFRVKEITSISFNYDGTLNIFAHPLERDVPVKEVVDAAPLAEPEKESATDYAVAF